MFHVFLWVPHVAESLAFLVFLNPRFLNLYIIYRSAKQFAEAIDVT